MKRAALFLRDAVSKQESYVGAVLPETLLGTSDSAHVQVRDLRCDGIHALITRNEETGDYSLVDLGSQYGTYVNGKRVREIRMKSGDFFVVGSQQLVLREATDEVSFKPESTRFEKSPFAANFPRKSSRSGGKPEGKTLATAQSLAKASLVQVSLYWGDQLLEIRTFEAGSDVTLGASQEATFGAVMQDPRAQSKPFTIARYTRGELRLELPLEASGIVWMGAESYSVDGLRHRDKATREFGDLSLGLKPGDKADIIIGQLTLSFRFVAPPERVKWSPWPKLNAAFFQLGAICLAIYSLILFGLYQTETQVVPPITLQEIPPSLKKSLFNAKLAKKLKAARASAIGELAQDKQGGRASGDEGKVSATLKAEKAAPRKVADHAERTPPRKAAPPRIQPKARVVHSTRSAPAAPAVKPPKALDLDRAFGSSAGESNLSHALTPSGKRQSGNSVAALTDPGAFARGTKGQGAGGGGKSVGIGSLSGSGTGGGAGAGDYGLTPSRGREIKAPVEEEVVIVGGLDQEVIASIIRRYLSQISHCYEQQLVSNPRLKGKVVVAFTISGTGSVSAAQVAETTLANAPTEKCMIQKILGWKFPKPRGGGTVGVKYPFLLMSNSGKGG